MEILVCVKQVLDSAEDEIKIKSDRTEIETQGLSWSINEADNHAVEEAIRIRDKVGGSVTVVSVGDVAAASVISREVAMGADRGIRIWDECFKGSDGKGIATILKGVVEKGHYDLVFTGTIASDDGAGQVGGMLAAMLNWPYASSVTYFELLSDKNIKIGRTVAGGNMEINEIDLPCVLSIETGINEPRYVTIRGIRKAESIEMPVYSTNEVDVAADSVGRAGAKVMRTDYFVPELGEGAEILQGDTEEIAHKLVSILRAKGGMK